ncbi:hypothetical protein AMELA_G00262170 [Ameiurus melas]|uniref:Reelin domain-containing protein n=1 Tax=Ameiurus melas TaxID=219545 RepID=A0A7J5ZRU0_AMEME|nr:hypothetical protein AMELA_G00262170 [Ameiurus melas]
MKPQIIIFIYFGGPILHFVKCYSSGIFGSDSDICQTMKVLHSNYQPQNTTPPFKVVPDKINVGSSDVGKSFDVTLKADDPESFRGFMLEARKTGSTTPQGSFSLVDTEYSRLQTCNGRKDTAVTQTDNQRKTEIKVKWNVSETGVYFFRATFVKSYRIFWENVNIFTTTAPTSTPDPFESSLTLHLLSYLCLAVCGPFLAKACVCVWTKVTSFLSLAFSLAAFILLLIDNKRVDTEILAGVAAGFNLCQTILIFCLCGPCHELRKVCFGLRLVAFINICFTIATIYLELVEHCSKPPCFWPAILMGVYLVCQLLSCPFFLYGELKQKQKRQTTSSNQNCRVSCWCRCLVIFTGMSLAFTVALVLGIFLCHCTFDT